MTIFTSNKDCILDAQHAKLEEIGCSRYGSHPALKLRYSCCLSSYSIPCQPLLHAHSHTAHLLERCASRVLLPPSGVFSPFLTQLATESSSTSRVTRMSRFALHRAAAGDGPCAATRAQHVPAPPARSPSLLHRTDKNQGKGGGKSAELTKRPVFPSLAQSAFRSR